MLTLFLLYIVTVRICEVWLNPLGNQLSNLLLDVWIMNYIAAKGFSSFRKGAQYTYSRCWFGISRYPCFNVGAQENAHVLLTGTILLVLI